MRNNFKISIIAIVGICVGVTAGYFVIKGVRVASTQTMSLVEGIHFPGDDVLSYGGPAVEDIFKNQEGDDVYFMDYKKTYKISQKAPVPYITAKSFIVGDLETGDIIFSKNKDETMPIASISKLMTAVLADEYVGLSKEIKMTDFAVSTYGRQGNLSVGEVYEVSDILYPLLLESSNDAAEAIAESLIRDNFIQKMNDKSFELEMFNTHFGDPSGLSPRNISTSSDLFKLSQYIEKYRSYIFGITKEKKYELGKKVWFSNSKFRSDDDYIGGKNGYTDEALKTQLAIFDIEISGESKKIIFIILKTDDIPGDIYGLKKYTEKYVTFE